MYIAFEDDGNVSVEFLLTLSGQSELIWTPITVTPGSAIDEEVFRKEQDVGNCVTLISTAHMKVENVGTETITVQGETFEAQRAEGELLATFVYQGLGGDPITMKFTYDVAWIDEIKMFGRYDIRIEGNPDFTRQVLTGYSLK